jgi:GTP-dependent phosphoenolpyruvate carboxykinase
MHWKAGPGKKVAIMGLGGLGHMGVKIARALGADVTVISHSDRKREDALKMGAHTFISTHNKSVFREYAEKFDLIINTISADINMGDYFGHWLSFAEQANLELPRMYCVNWFRKGADGKFIWPGYSENMRVLKWIFGRVKGESEARRTPLGFSPAMNDLDWTGLDQFPADMFEELNKVDPAAWEKELESHREFLGKFMSRLPKKLMDMNERLVQNLRNLN